MPHAADAEGAASKQETMNPGLFARERHGSPLTASLVWV